jgi:hypothetical protein
MNIDLGRNEDTILNGPGQYQHEDGTNEQEDGGVTTREKTISAEATVYQDESHKGQGRHESLKKTSSPGSTKTARAGKRRSARNLGKG